MSLKKAFTFIFCLTFLCTGAIAQVTIPKETTGNAGFSTRGRVMERGKLMDPKRERDATPVGQGRYSDGKLEEMGKAMMEREWNSEETAWKRAEILSTKEAYLKYIGMYPNGAHIAAANSRLVDINVDEAFKSDHGSLPKLDRVLADDDSKTSTIIIENHTGYPLTLMYSGQESKAIVINPGGTGTVTLENGSYKIAASVPVAGIRPFAGNEELLGGRYETGFVIAPIYR